MPPIAGLHSSPARAGPCDRAISGNLTLADIIIHLAAMALADLGGCGYVLSSEGKNVVGSRTRMRTVPGRGEAEVPVTLPARYLPIHRKVLGWQPRSSRISRTSF